MAQLHSIRLYITLPLLYFTLLDSTLPYHGSALLYIIVPWLYFSLLDSIHHSTMAQLHSSWLYITLPWLFFTLHDSTELYHGTSSLYVTLQNSTMVYFSLLDYIQLYTMAKLHSTWLYITLPWLYFTLLDSASIYHCSTSLYYTLHYSTMALFHTTWLYITLPCLYFTLLYCTSLYHGSTSLY